MPVSIILSSKVTDGYALFDVGEICVCVIGRYPYTFLTLAVHVCRFVHPMSPNTAVRWALLTAINPTMVHNKNRTSLLQGHFSCNVVTLFHSIRLLVSEERSHKTGKLRLRLYI